MPKAHVDSRGIRKCAKGVGEDTKGRLEERGVGRCGRQRVEGLQVVLQKPLEKREKGAKNAREDTRVKGGI